MDGKGVGNGVVKNMKVESSIPLNELKLIGFKMGIGVELYSWIRSKQKYLKLVFFTLYLFQITTIVNNLSKRFKL